MFLHLMLRRLITTLPMDSMWLLVVDGIPLYIRGEHVGKRPRSLRMPCCSLVIDLAVIMVYVLVPSLCKIRCGKNREPYWKRKNLRINYTHWITTSIS